MVEGRLGRRSGGLSGELSGDVFAEAAKSGGVESEAMAEKRESCKNIVRCCVFRRAFRLRI